MREATSYHVVPGAALLGDVNCQTAESGLPGPGIGLVLGWITVLLLAFHWARVVWTRTAVQMAAEAQRRDEAARRQTRTLLDGLGGESSPSDER